MSPTPKRVRVHHLREAKERGERLTMLTAYDAVTARIFDEAGIDMLLVGDSIGNTMHGHTTTLPVTVDDLIPPARAVAGAAKRAFVVADLPFGSYEAGPAQALETAVRMMKETGVAAVKFEGGKRVAAQIKALTDAGIPVVAHLGYTPQSENLLGGPRVQGRGDLAAELLCEDAVAIQEAGAVAVVLEMVPAPVAARVTEILHIPTIGIGAGAAVRRPGARLGRHGRHDRLVAALREAVRRGRRGAQGRGRRLRRRGARRHVPGRAHQFDA